MERERQSNDRTLVAAFPKALLDRGLPQALVGRLWSRRALWLLQARVIAFEAAHCVHCRLKAFKRLLLAVPSSEACNVF